MDRLMSKVGLFLTCFFSLCFLAFLAEIIYVFLSRRRRFKRQPDPAGIDHQVTRVQTRSQMSAIPVAVLVKLQNYARLLSTIKEEEDKEGVDRSPQDPSRRHVSVEVVTEQGKSDKSSFETPCDSPVAYFTPNASPHV